MTILVIIEIPSASLANIWCFIEKKLTSPSMDIITHSPEFFATITRLSLGSLAFMYLTHIFVLLLSYSLEFYYDVIYCTRIKVPVKWRL